MSRMCVTRTTETWGLRRVLAGAGPASDMCGQGSGHQAPSAPCQQHHRDPGKLPFEQKCQRGTSSCPRTQCGSLQKGCLPQVPHLQTPVGEAQSWRWARGLRDGAQAWVRGGGSRAVVRVPERDGQLLSSLRQEPGPIKEGAGWWDRVASGQRSEDLLWGQPQDFLQRPEQHPGPGAGCPSEDVLSSKGG